MSKFFKPNSKVQINVNIQEYFVDWNRVVSKPQKQVKDFLRPYWKSHIVLEEFRIPSTLWRVDLINMTRRIAVEVSPKGSHSFNTFFHRDRFKFGAAMDRDNNKAKWVENNGFVFVEVFDDDLDNLSPEWFKSKYDIDL